MSFDPAILAARLAQLENSAAKPHRYVVAYSGGLDSMVLLHALASRRRARSDKTSVPLLAIHVDHGLQKESAAWSEHCAEAAEALGVEFLNLQVAVELDSGKGLEAAARDARYRALRSQLRSDDWLLSAHHREDQAETLLLNLIRGSGPAGVAGIGEVQRFGSGWLVRPMLHVGQAEILEYAKLEDLSWVEDPTNTDRRFDRNFLRHAVMPILSARWPDIASRLQRSAGHAGEASELLTELAKMDVMTFATGTARLPVAGLAALSEARQRNVIRYALRDQGLSTPTAAQLDRVITEVIPAREDAEPLVSWPGAAVRRYRNGLYLLPENLPRTVEPAAFSGDELELGEGLGTLRLLAKADIGISAALVAGGLSVKPRTGGEEFKLHGQRHTRKLKKLLQEEGVVPWMRERLPLVYAGDRLVAVADLWLADGATSEPGVGLEWINRPALH